MNHVLENNSELCVASSSSLAIPVYKNKLRALVVDDNLLSRKCLIASLQKLGVETQEAIDGKDAIETFIAGAQFNLVFMDKEMPVMDGLEATRKLRTMGIQIKIVGVSSVERKEDIQNFIDAGLDEFFVKPIKSSQLVKLLQEVDDQI